MVFSQILLIMSFWNYPLSDFTALHSITHFGLGWFKCQFYWWGLRFKGVSSSHDLRITCAYLYIAHTLVYGMFISVINWFIRSFIHIIGDHTDEQVAAIMAAHQRRLHESMSRLDQNRARQDASMRQRLAERRQRKMKELHEKHSQEVTTNTTGWSMLEGAVLIEAVYLCC